MQMKKNYDPRMHSAEHILNQTMDRMYQCGRCFNAHIERKKSKCDYHFTKSLTADEIEAVQSRVNRIIQSELPVSEQFISKSEVENRFNTE
jgi:Ser-tRNA(Ala) deacylase AlaX